MSSLSRRIVIVSIGGIVCAGRAGSDESGPDLEYEISDLQGADEVPDGVVEHPNPEDFRWIAVAVNVTEGEISSGELYGLTQIGVGDATEPARAVDVEEVTNDVDDLKERVDDVEETADQPSPPTRRSPPPSTAH